MPEKQTISRARKKAREGKSPSTQAGEFVREEMHHIRAGKHGARSPKQAIAIGLSKARRAGVRLPKKSSSSRSHNGKDERQTTKRSQNRPSAKRSRAITAALKREPRSSASPASLSRHAEQAAARRGSQARRAAARKAVRTKGAAGLRRAGKKAVETRARRA